MSIRRLMVTACRRPQLRRAFSRIAMVLPVQARRAMASVSSIDSVVFQDLFGADEMQEVFSDTEYISRCVNAEAVLAREPAHYNVIPADVAQAIPSSVSVIGPDHEIIPMNKA